MHHYSAPPLLGEARVIPTTGENIRNHWETQRRNTVDCSVQEFLGCSDRNKEFGRAISVGWIFVRPSRLRHDWELESSTMHDYRRYAYLTIAATYASDGSVGCFQPRNPLKFQPCMVKLRFNPRNLRPDPTIEEYDFVSAYYSSCVKSLPESEYQTQALDHRAWCIQEAMFLTRILKFDKSTLRWMCNEKRASEGPPCGYTRPDCIGDGGDVETHNPASPVFPCGFENRVLEDLYDFRMVEIVTRYTNRKLIIAADMLPALAKLANETHLLLGHSKHLASLWQGS